MSQGQINEGIAKLDIGQLVPILQSLAGQVKSFLTNLLLFAMVVLFVSFDAPGFVRQMRGEHDQHAQMADALVGFARGVRRYFVVSAVFGPVLRLALTHGWVMNLVYLVAVAAGCLLAWPLLGEDLLPAWCSAPLRMLFAALDGLLDAIPGIALVASGPLVAGGYFAAHRPPWIEDAHANQQTAGTLAVAIAEVVAVPLLVMLFFQWARSELRADAAEGVVVGAGTLVQGTDVSGSSQPGAEGPALDRPWWQTDPGFGRRTEEFRGR